jgi:hypothetical protein
MTDEPIDDLGDDGEAVVLFIRSAATIIFRAAERPEQAEKFLRGAVEAALMDLRLSDPPPNMNAEAWARWAWRGTA